MKRLRKIVEAIEDWTAGMLIISGLFLLFYAIIIRSVFQLSTTWEDEVSRILIIWGTLIGASVALRDNKHIRVELLYNLFSKKLQRWINIFANLISLLFFVFLIFSGKELVQIRYETGQTSVSGIPLWIIYLIIPLAGLLMSLRSIERLILLFRGKTESDTEGEELGLLEKE